MVAVDLGVTTAGTTLTDLLMTPSWSNRWSGTFTSPTLGSIMSFVVTIDYYSIIIPYSITYKVSPIVQKGKLAA